jgi:GntR family transcriptional regulator of vanillate catabolism
MRHVAPTELDLERLGMSEIGDDDPDAEGPATGPTDESRASGASLGPDRAAGEHSSNAVPESRRPANDVESQTGRAFIGVRELLMRGEFARGERISELPLVARLGMSRTPIRLALERLAHVGLVEAGKSGGFLVREFTVADVRDAIELRGVLEGTAARFAAERYEDPSELEPLRGACDAVADISVLSMDSFARYMDHNEAFHAAILKLAKSKMLERLIMQANSLPFASPSAMVYPTSMLAAAQQAYTVAVEQHRSLVEAIEHREGSRAEHLAREHARIALRVLELALANEGGLSGVPGAQLISLSNDGRSMR